MIAPNAWFTITTAGLIEHGRLPGVDRALGKGEPSLMVKVSCMEHEFGAGDEC